MVPSRIFMICNINYIMSTQNIVFEKQLFSPKCYRNLNFQVNWSKPGILGSSGILVGCICECVSLCECERDCFLKCAVVINIIRNKIKKLESHTNKNIRKIKVVHVKACQVRPKLYFWANI